MTFTNYILNYHKKLNVLPTLSTRMLSNMIDIFISLIILSPLYSMISVMVFGGGSMIEIMPEYDNIKQNLESITTLEKEQFLKKSLEHFYSNNGVFKILLNQCAQFSILLLLTLSSWLYFKTSPGKYIMGLKIVDQKTHGVPSTRQFIIRAIAIYLNIITLGITYLILVFG